MATDQEPEYWMRGPVNHIPDLLQPVAHCLLQVRKEVHELMLDLPSSLLWEKPAGMASPAFHLQHISGVLDRLFTYAQGKGLGPGQLKALTEEGRYREGLSKEDLIAALDHQVAQSLDQLAGMDPATLTAFRGVGRKQLPSTVMGLLFHAAEHSMRHLGQLIVTVRVLESGVYFSSKNGTNGLDSDPKNTHTKQGTAGGGQ